jgi:hypothetical protein
MTILSMAVSGIMIGSSLAMLLNAGAHPLSELFQVILLLLGIAMSMTAYPAFREGKTFVSSETMKNIANLRPAGRIPKKLTDDEILKHNSTILFCPICDEEVEQPWGEVISVCKECHRLLSDEVKVVHMILPNQIRLPKRRWKVNQSTFHSGSTMWRLR